MPRNRNFGGMVSKPNQLSLFENNKEFDRSNVIGAISEHNKKCYFCPLLDLKVYRMLAEQVGAVSCKGENANLHVYTIHQMSETHFLSSFAPHDVLYCLYLWASNGYKPIKIRSFAPFFDETAHYSSTMPRK